MMHRLDAPKWCDVHHGIIEEDQTDDYCDNNPDGISNADGECTAQALYVDRDAS